MRPVRTWRPVGRVRPVRSCPLGSVRVGSVSVRGCGWDRVGFVCRCRAHVGGPRVAPVDARWLADAVADNESTMVGRRLVGRQRVDDVGRRLVGRQQGDDVGQPSVDSLDTTAVTALARRFDSPACRVLVSAEHRQPWRSSNLPIRHSLGMHVRQQVYHFDFGNGRRAKYVRNQKVASMQITEGCIGARNKPGSWLSRQFSVASNCTELIVKYDDDPTTRLGNASTRRAFSFVREPVAHALSAYLHVTTMNEAHLQKYPDRACPGSSRHPRLRDAEARMLGSRTIADFTMRGNHTPSVQNMSCATRADATRRFSAFLDAIERQEALGDWFYHAWPQAMKLNAVGTVAPRFAALGRLERFANDLRAVAAVLGVDVHRDQERTVGRTPLRHTQWHTRASAGESLCATNVDSSDPQVLRKVCALYAADYACFGFPLPHACT
jgi:hypothetical protein